MQDAECVSQDMFSKELHMHIPMEINPYGSIHTMSITWTMVNNMSNPPIKVGFHTICMIFFQWFICLSNLGNPWELCNLILPGD